MVTGSANYPVDEAYDHEYIHNRQWNTLGLSFAPLHGLASLYSLAKTGTYACANIFEQLAGLTRDYATQCGR